MKEKKLHRLNEVWKEDNLWYIQATNGVMGFKRKKEAILWQKTMSKSFTPEYISKWEQNRKLRLQEKNLWECYSK